MKTVHIIGETLPECWEKAVLACWEQGDSFPTQYDKLGDPNSRDVTILIHIKKPMKEPRIHRSFPGGLEDLEKYRSEVLWGVHDHWINPKEGKWEYTYHERLFEYDFLTEIDQIAECIKMLKNCGFTRRAQAVTWKVWEDLNINDSPCLQRLWFRVQNGKLNMNIHMRSNDSFKAAFMNIYAFVELQKWVADQVGVEIGEYIHIVDSFHIYGSYFKEFEGFLETVKNRKFEDRVWRSDDKDIVIPSFIDGCNVLLQEQNMPEIMKEKVRERKLYLESLI